MFVKKMSLYNRIVTCEEHVKPGGLGSYISELIVDDNLKLSITRIALDFSKGLYHKYGTRDEMLDDCGLSPALIAKEVRKSI